MLNRRVGGIQTSLSMFKIHHRYRSVRGKPIQLDASPDMNSLMNGDVIIDTMPPPKPFDAID